jgi:hypothetical protein
MLKYYHLGLPLMFTKHRWWCQLNSTKRLKGRKGTRRHGCHGCFTSLTVGNKKKVWERIRPMYMPMTNAFLFSHKKCQICFNLECPRQIGQFCKAGFFIRKQLGRKRASHRHVWRHVGDAWVVRSGGPPKEVFFWPATLTKMCFVIFQTWNWGQKIRIWMLLQLD